MNKRIEIISGARLHITLIDMNGSVSQRVDGGLGIVLEHPRINLSAGKRNDNEINLVYAKENLSENNELLEGVSRTLKKLQKTYSLGGVNVSFKELIPVHAGFGSKTQILLSSSYAFLKLYGYEFNNRELGKLIGRGGTSGIGIEAFNNGGLIVDCGHNFNDKKKEFNPSSKSTNISPPPLVGQYQFPDWPVLIVTPKKGIKIHGMLEKKLFDKVCPIPISDVEKCAYVAMMMTIPSVIEENFNIFTKSIEIFQTLRWKKFEIESQSLIVRKTMDFLSEIGLSGIGMSSWGATVFAFGNPLKEAPDLIEKKVDKFLKKNGGGSFFITKIRNKGASINYFNY